MCDGGSRFQATQLWSCAEKTQQFCQASLGALASGPPSSPLPCKGPRSLWASLLQPSCSSFIRCPQDAHVQTCVLVASCSCFSFFPPSQGQRCRLLVR